MALIDRMIDKSIKESGYVNIIVTLFLFIQYIDFVYIIRYNSIAYVKCVYVKYFFERSFYF